MLSDVRFEQNDLREYRMERRVDSSCPRKSCYCMKQHNDEKMEERTSDVPMQTNVVASHPALKK